MYRVYCLNYILNGSEFKLKNTIYFDRLLPHNNIFNKRIWIIRCFQTHCKLFTTFTLRDMSFKTKLTLLVNNRGLTDRASLKNHQNNDRNTGGLNWPKTFWGGVYVYLHIDEVQINLERQSCLLNFRDVSHVDNSLISGMCTQRVIVMTLRWRHNGRDGFSNHQPYHCLLNRLFRRRSKKTSVLCQWPLCGEFTGDRWIPRTNGQ